MQQYPAEMTLFVFYLYKSKYITLQYPLFYFCLVFNQIFSTFAENYNFFESNLFYETFI
jgi:hypothetical protein